MRVTSMVWFIVWVIMAPVTLAVTHANHWGYLLVCVPYGIIAGYGAGVINDL